MEQRSTHNRRVVTQSNLSKIPSFKAKKNNGLLVSVIVALSISLLILSATFVVFCIGSDGQFLWEINTWLTP